MDQVHYHGPITVQGANYQSHYVPAEKPYAVYAFVWEESSTDIAQLIGTMLVGKVNDKGEMVFDNKAVYRMPDKHRMLDFMHCFVAEDMGKLSSNPIHLGFEGDTVGIKELIDVVWMQLKFGEGTNVKSFVDNMRLAGLKVELGGDHKMQEVDAFFDFNYDYQTKEKDYLIGLNNEIALREEIWTNGKSAPSRNVLSGLWQQIENWQEVGVSFEHIKIESKDLDYQKQVDELLELTKLYGKYKKMNTCLSQLYYLLLCRDMIGTDRCFYDDFVMGMKKAQYNNYSKYDEDLQWAINVGLASREGNIIRFSTDFERMATWQWKWKEGDERK